MSTIDEDPVEAVQKKLEVVHDLWVLACPAKTRAAFADAMAAAEKLGEFEREKIDYDLKSRKADVDELTARERVPEQYAAKVEGYVNSLEHSVERARDYPDDEDQGYVNTVANVRHVLEDEDNRKLLGSDAIARFERKLAWFAGEVEKARTGARIKRAEELDAKIQAVLSGEDTSTYLDTVEKWFKWSAEALAKCPADHAKASALRAKLATQRQAFDQQLLETATKEVIQPALDYWTYNNETYGPEVAGWEAETQPPTVKAFVNSAPPSLGCPKTERFLGEIVVRWLEDYRTKEALEKYPKLASFKPTYDEATRLREAAGGKVCAFANALLSEGEKLPAGRERDDLQMLLGELRRVVEQNTKGSTACEKTLTRIEAIDKRWRDAKEKGEADRAALEKALGEATNAAWPDLVAGLRDRVKKLDATSALANIDAWKDTVLHFTGGARGVNLNRSGWNYQDEYDFIVEVDGVPVCGNFDGGLSMGLKAFSAETGVEPDNCEECFGIVDGTCRVWERVQHPLDKERYVRGRQLECVRMRIVAWKACTVAACAGVGTSLPKFSGGSDVSVPDLGQPR